MGSREVVIQGSTKLKSGRRLAVTKLQTTLWIRSRRSFGRRKLRSGKNLDVLINLV